MSCTNICNVIFYGGIFFLFYKISCYINKKYILIFILLITLLLNLYFFIVFHIFKKFDIF